MDYVRNARAAVLLLLSFQCVVKITVVAIWNYDENGPSEWPVLFPNYCSGSKQSPIDIVTSSAQGTNEYTDLKLTGYNTTPAQTYFDFLDNGHSVQVNVRTTAIRATGASLMNGNYTLEQFHFHWGNTSCNEGSEHTINGKAFPLEIHFVHYNSDRYTSVSQAAASNNETAIAVFAVFVDVSNGSTSSDFSTLIANISNIPEEGSHANITSFRLQSLLPCTNSRVFTYHGSLTTPNCSEVVIWNVFEKPIYITMAELEKFRTVKGDANKPVDKNFRPTQPLNGRIVSWYNVTASSGGSCPELMSLSDTDCTMSSSAPSSPPSSSSTTQRVSGAGKIYGHKVYAVITLITAAIGWFF